MKTEEALVLGLAGLAVWFIVKGQAVQSARGLSASLQQAATRFEEAGGRLWTDTESAYNGTWTSAGPFNLGTYDKQIWD